MELNFRTVKALSSPTRIRILNQLLEKERTPTQLSDDIGRSKSTVSSHLDTLVAAGLVDRDQEKGRKRVVYSPTRKAETIVKGRERKVRFSIASSAITGIAGISILGYSYLQRLSSGMHASADAGEAQQLSAATTEAVNTTSQSAPAVTPENFFLGAGIFLLGLSVGTFVYGLLMKKLGSET